jgi:catechol 2,3-dioxygenase-like lactoylglutathione lyase family enzyme
MPPVGSHNHAGFRRNDAMNRFHIHVHVIDLPANIRFYSQLFGAEPSVVKPDYAKWLLDDPQLNFAISNPHDGKVPGIAHMGLQAGNGEALEVIGNRLKAADSVALAEAGTTCCYAQSDKYWAQDPQGLLWETFHTHGEATTYSSPAVDASAPPSDGIAAGVQACSSGRCGPAAVETPPRAAAVACC